MKRPVCLTIMLVSVVLGVRTGSAANPGDADGLIESPRTPIAVEINETRPKPKPKPCGSTRGICR